MPDGDRARIVLAAAVALTMMLAPTAAVFGQDQGGAAGGPLSKLSIHGFLTQAYAVGGEGETQSLGINGDGTTDYRNAALQFRYELAESDGFVIQLSHSRLGDSPAQQFFEEVELDWAFYQHSFAQGTTLKVGKVQVPIGIYNEIRDVGTLLPFYRPSPNIYGENTWTSETVDGLVVGHSFGAASRWGLDLDAYFGSWARIENDSSTQSYVETDVDRAIGFQLWLNTPVSGLRFGVGYNQYDVTGGLFLPANVTEAQDTLYLSLDASFERFFVRSEYQDNQYDGGFWKAYYAELGVNVTSRLTLVGRYDVADLKFTVPFFAVFNKEYSNDTAVGLNYKFRPDLVLKAEYHWGENYDIENRPVNTFFEPIPEVSYGIVSLSVSF